MSYGFMVWAVDIDRLRQAAGSKDAALIDAVAARFGCELSELDDLLAGSGSGAREALRQLVDGAIPERAAGSVYRYAFKLLVWHLGAFLDNGAVSAWGHADFAPVNRALDAMAVPFTLDAFYGLSLPVALPPPDDFPLTGWVDAATARAIHEAFARAPAVDMDADTAQVVACMRGWFRAAAAGGAGLVSYYH